MYGFHCFQICSPYRIVKRGRVFGVEDRYRNDVFAKAPKSSLSFSKRTTNLNAFKHNLKKHYFWRKLESQVFKKNYYHYYNYKYHCH